MTHAVAREMLWCESNALTRRSVTMSIRPEREPAYGRYLAALRREEHAAGLYERQLDWVRRVCT